MLLLLRLLLRLLLLAQGDRKHVWVLRQQRQRRRADEPRAKVEPLIEQRVAALALTTSSIGASTTSTSTTPTAASTTTAATATAAAS